MYISEQLSWYDSDRYCQNINGRLAEPRTLKEYLFFRYIRETFDTDLWLGGNDLANEGRFVWLSDSEPVENEAFNVWVPGEPNNSRGIEHCLEFTHSEGSSRAFNDEPCSEFILDFVCEILHNAGDYRCL